MNDEKYLAEVWHKVSELEQIERELKIAKEQSRRLRLREACIAGIILIVCIISVVMMNFISSDVASNLQGAIIAFFLAMLVSAMFFELRESDSKGEIYE